MFITILKTLINSYAISFQISIKIFLIYVLEFDVFVAWHYLTIRLRGRDFYEVILLIRAKPESTNIISLKSRVRYFF